MEEIQGMIRLDLLKPHPNNPRTISDEALEQLKVSIQELDKMFEARPIAYDEDYVIWGGNQRYNALLKLGYEVIPESWTYQMKDWTLAQKKSFAIKDNVPLGKWDNEKALDDYWKEYTHEYGDEDLKSLFEHLDDVGGESYDLEEDEFESDIELIKTNIKLGDIIEIGKHRLMCGDSTSKDDVEKLMNGKAADISIQSPPYNIGKTPNGDKKKYLEDVDTKDDDKYLFLLNAVTENAIQHSVFTFVNIQSVAGNKKTIIDYLSSQKKVFCDYIIWDKLQSEPAMGENIMNSRFEFVYVFGEEAKRRIGVKKFRGNLDNIIFIKSRQDKEYAKYHKATYPIAFAAYFINNFSVQSCLDLFSGTGTTIVAAEETGRACFAMDNEPRYCQITIDRMMKRFPEIVVTINGVQYQTNE